MAGLVAGGIGPAAKADIPEAADVLARAFDDDPELRAFIDGRDRQHRLHLYLAAEARLNLDKGGVIDLYRNAAGEVAGVAVWEPSNARETLGQTIRYAPAMLRGVGWRGLVNWLLYRSDFKRLQPAGPHWHLVRLVTDASSRGQGVGTGLLRHRLEAIDRQGGVAHLEASSAASARLYRRLGFETVGEFRLPPATLILAMTRPTQRR
jgi:ribosomal protein S18 acetylase RimI-like enzyme